MCSWTKTHYWFLFKLLDFLTKLEYLIFVINQKKESNLMSTLASMELKISTLNYFDFCDILWLDFEKVNVFKYININLKNKNHDFERIFWNYRGVGKGGAGGLRSLSPRCPNNWNFLKKLIHKIFQFPQVKLRHFTK